MKLLFALRSIFLLPHFFVFKLCEKHDVLCKDLESWRKLCPKKNNCSYTYLFFYMMCHFKEFRNVFYLRLGNIKYFLKIFKKISKKCLTDYDNWVKISLLLRYTTARQRKLWLVGQEAKTPPSHGGIRGSIPLQATICDTERVGRDVHSFVHI